MPESKEVALPQNQKISLLHEITGTEEKKEDFEQTGDGQWSTVMPQRSVNMLV